MAGRAALELKVADLAAIQAVGRNLPSRKGVSPVFALPELPYAYDALKPAMSDRTLHFHHDKHHAAYVNTLNALLKTAGKAPETLESLILETSRSGERKLFNNAAQAWNHSFFWASMSAERQRPGKDLAAAIDSAFGDLDGLKKAFVEEGVGHFGSGWVWLTAEHGGGLKLCSTHDADNILTRADMTPLWVCDLWEHAYYLDHQNDRKGFLAAWFDALPNWRLATAQHSAADGRGELWRHPPPVTAA
jgi:Fe-Mn family superoxide dismutase